MKKSNKYKIKPRFESKIAYVLFKDIVKGYGKKWANKWNKAFGPGNTGLLTKKGEFGIYWHDFVRFHDLIEYNKETYWD